MKRATFPLKWLVYHRLRRLSSLTIMQKYNKQSQWACVAALILLSACSTQSPRPDTADQVLDVTPTAPDPGIKEAFSDNILLPRLDIETRPQQSVAIDGDDIWQRLRQGLRFAGHEDHPLVQRHLEQYLNNPDYILRVSERAAPYLHFIMQQIEQRDLPMELALLPIIESAYVPFAYSQGRAAGLWQFIPATGRHFGLKQNWWYDGRRDIYASTQAALNYLQKLNRRFEGDWMLTLAAYNAGPGTVSRAIERNRRAARSMAYWDLPLSAETRNYVPKLLAVKAIFSQPWRYSIDLPTIADTHHFQHVVIAGQIDLAQAAELAGIDVESLYRLNPGFNRWATDPEGPHYLLIPAAHAERFEQALAELPADQHVSWVRHKIQPGDTLSEIARRYHTSTQLLKQINKLSGHRIHAGRHLLVPKAQRRMDEYMLASTQRQQRLQSTQREGIRRLYTVMHGDSFWSIAKAHNVSLNKLTRWNGMAPGDILRPGDELVIWLPSVNENAYLTPASLGPPSSQHSLRTIHYAVRPGDSLYRIARKFSVSITDIKSWNKIKGKHLRPGQKLTLYVDVTKQQG